jgi:protein-L-isoaspartate(D-aspartate) O-methyltransferase
MAVRRSGAPEDLVRAARDHGVRDPRLLEAIRAIPRARFVPAEHVSRAYADAPVPIARGQVTTQPSLVAAMIEALGLSGDERVLEVGTGLGWQTALLSRLAREVVSVERWPDLAAAARENLAGAGVRNASVIVGDGSLGWPEGAPYEAILVSAAFPEVPPPLAEQLTPSGRLVMPIGRGGAERVILFAAGPEGLRPVRTVTDAHFVRLIGAHGFEDPR